jgi:O-antigen/teichoic acid export membrane protein
MRLNTAGRVAKNSIALSIALLVRRVASFVLYVLIARYLGVLIFGQFSLAYSFFLILEVPAVFGLVSLIVREVAKNRSDFDKYLIHSHLIVLISSLCCIALWALLVHLLGYSPEVIKISYLLGLALIPFAMRRVCEAIFQAFERMQFTAYAVAVANLAMIGLSWLLLSRGFGLTWIVGLVAVVQLSILLLEWYFIYRFLSKPSWVIDLSFCWRLAKVATTFLGIGIFAVIFLRLNVIVLSKLRGELEVGLYNAAFQLSYFFMVASRSLKEAIYPVFSKTRLSTNLARFKQYAEYSIEVLISMALPLAVGFFFLADSVLLLYKKEFIAAAPVLRVIAWLLIPLCFERIFGSIFMASGHQRANLVINILCSAILFVLSVVCIYYFGLMGAGLAILGSHVISFGLRYGYLSKRIFLISIPRVIWKPAVSSLLLAGFLALLGQDHGLPVTVSSAIVFYGAVLYSLNFFCGGPLRPVKAWTPECTSKPEVSGIEI